VSDDEIKDCGHTQADHEQMHDLVHLVQHVQAIEDPRVALIITDDGEIHFATSIHPREAAQALEEMAQRIRRYGSNYVRDHFDRGQAARWN
jgi:hypothetical protein